jgi:hypothetical protein
VPLKSSPIEVLAIHVLVAGTMMVAASTCEPRRESLRLLHPVIHPIVQPHPQPLQSILSVVNELHELVLDREADLPHANFKAREISQVVLSSAQERFELIEGKVGKVHRAAQRVPEMLPWAGCLKTNREFTAREAA